MSDLDSDQIVNTVSVTDITISSCLSTDQAENSLGAGDVGMSPYFEWGLSFWAETTSYWGLGPYPFGGMVSDSLVAAVFIQDVQL
jgi:hypothetical protein